MQINLAALTRMEYSEEIVVPVELNDKLDELVSLAFDELECSDFNDDPDYWERGNCWHETLEDNSNCLAGMRCPQCASLGPFKLATKGPDPEAGYGMGKIELSRAIESGEIRIIEYMAEWNDSGAIDTAGDTELVADGDGECPSCGFEGSVKDFRG